MAKQDEPDFFEEPETQGDLFGEDGPAERTWTPDRDKVRRRLERILAEARAAETMQWNRTRQSLYQEIFPDMANLLPEKEAAQYRFRFEAEWERLNEGRAIPAQSE